MNRVGGIFVVDLEALYNLRVGSALPYPLGRSRPVGSAWLLGLDESPLAERLDGATSSAFRKWVEACIDADIWVECRVNYTCGEKPDTRILAYRSEQSGLLAKQRPDENLRDVVEIYSLPAHDLGGAIADAVGLTQPGSHPRITIPRFSGSNSADAWDDEDYSVDIRDTPPGKSSPLIVDDTRVRAMGAVQSRCDPARAWGVDQSRDLIAWVHVDDDGDYAFSTDFSVAMPLSARALQGRIDALIANDVATLRRRRGDR